MSRVWGLVGPWAVVAACAAAIGVILWAVAVADEVLQRRRDRKAQNGRQGACDDPDGPQDPDPAHEPLADADDVAALEALYALPAHNPDRTDQ